MTPIKSAEDTPTNDCHRHTQCTGASFTSFWQQATPHIPRKEVSSASAEAKVRGGLW